MPLVIEVGGKDSDSYVSLDFITEYLTHYEGRVVVERWRALADDGKERVVRSAVRLLDRLYRWRGSRTYHEQVLEFPRQGLYDDGLYLDSTELPPRLVESEALMVVWVLSDRGSDFESSVDVDSAISKVEVGDIKISYSNVEDRNDRLMRLTASREVGMIKAMLNEYIEGELLLSRDDMRWGVLPVVR